MLWEMYSVIICSDLRSTFVISRRTCLEHEMYNELHFPIHIAGILSRVALEGEEFTVYLSPLTCWPT